MSKTFAWVMGSILLLSLSILSTSQYITIEDLKKQVVNLGQENNYLDASLQEEMALSKKKTNQILSLRQELSERDETIAQLNADLKYYKNRVSKLTKASKIFDKKMAILKQENQNLEKQILDLKNNGSSSAQKIASLEAEKVSLNQKILTLEENKEKVQSYQIKTEAEMLKRQIEQARLKKIASVVNKTSVRFNKITTQKKRFGRPITNIKNGKNWNYTIIELQMDHPDSQEILDEAFKVKIVNSDTKEVLSFIESNPHFPNSTMDTKGVSFKNTNGKIELSYFNNGLKFGENYELQMFYLESNGEEHRIMGGTKPFVINKKLVTKK